MLAMPPSGELNTTVMNAPDLLTTFMPCRRSARATAYSSTTISAGVAFSLR